MIRACATLHSGIPIVQCVGSRPSASSKSYQHFVEDDLDPVAYLCEVKWILQDLIPADWLPMSVCVACTNCTLVEDLLGMMEVAKVS